MLKKSTERTISYGIFTICWITLGLKNIWNLEKIEKNLCNYSDFLQCSKLNQGPVGKKQELQICHFIVKRAYR